MQCMSPRASRTSQPVQNVVHEPELVHSAREATTQSQADLQKTGQRLDDMSNKMSDLTLMLHQQSKVMTAFFEANEQRQHQQHLQLQQQQLQPMTSRTHELSLGMVNASLEALRNTQSQMFDKLTSLELAHENHSLEIGDEGNGHHISRNVKSGMVPPTDANDLHAAMRSLQNESKALRQLVETQDFASFKNEIGQDIAGLRREVADLRDTVDKRNADADYTMREQFFLADPDPEIADTKGIENTPQPPTAISSPRKQEDVERGRPTSGDSPIVSGSLRLDRKKLTERIALESNMEMNCPHYLTFVFLLVLTLVCMASYDPVNQVGTIHNNLRSRFKVEDAENCRTTIEITQYVETFLNIAYNMAPALIDANTMNSIDFARCFDPYVNDICRLTYWYLDPNSSSRNGDQVIRDKLSPENGPSVLDCPAQGQGKPNCLDRSAMLDSTLQSRTLGLMPENPIIYKSRQEYAAASIVPMTPIMWQTRGTRRPCSGFGNKYNHEVLGAGACKENAKACNPNTVTAFSGARPAKSDDRGQTFFLTYSEDVFFCVDRNLIDDSFYDQSWHPWAGYENFHPGIERKAVDFNGQQVFYKFISDIAYIQKPVPELVQLPDRYEDACPNGPLGAPFQTPLPAGVRVSDPLLNPDHDLWKEAQDNSIYAVQCSMRKLWSQAFLNSKTEYRASSFITMESNEVTLAALVLTPQSEEFADVQTLIRVVWTIDQGGSISSQVFLQSTSQTSALWFVWVALVLLVGFVEVIQGALAIFGCSTPGMSHHHHLQQNPSLKLGTTMSVKLQRKNARTIGILDVLSALSAMALVLANLFLELLPPDVTSDLLNAYSKNNEEVYFEVFRSIVAYNENLRTLKNFGFVVIILLFVRSVLYLVLHPRMAVLVNTLAHLGDKFFHFMLYFIFILVILTFIGWWMFAEIKFTEYGTFTRTLYTQFQMFTGSFPFASNPPGLSELFYLVLTTLIVFIILVNFLLAIVVDSYQFVTRELERHVTSQNVNFDMFDVVYTWIRRHLRGYPTAKSILTAMDRLDGDGLEYVTGEILFNEMQNQGESFKSSEHAASYLDMYANKLKKHGEPALKWQEHARETTSTMTLPLR